MVGSGATQTVTMARNAFTLAGSAGAAVVLIAGCGTSAVVTEAPDNDAIKTPVAVIGVDSTVLAEALILAGKSFAPDTGLAARKAASGQRYALMADSLLRSPAWEHLRMPAHTDSADSEAVTRATERFNDGAKALEEWTVAGSDSVEAGQLLNEAAQEFEAALKADPFDVEVRYWLAHVYELQIEHFDLKASTAAAIQVARRLVTLHQNRHDYIGLLARLHEYLDSEGGFLASGALWARAAQVAQDDAELDPGRQLDADSVIIFGYLMRSSRAYGDADRADEALRMLDAADMWITAEEEVDLVQADRNWLLWDDGNLQTRRTYDRILESVLQRIRKVQRTTWRDY